jgi:DNA-binding FadR family transcriptional regulator
MGRSARAVATRQQTATPRRSEKKSKAVARQIVDDVLSRGLRPGTVLASEAAMLRDYAVGRPTLREALRILEVHGMLEIRPGPGGGPILAGAGSRGYARTSSLFFQMSGVRLLDVMDARLTVEPMMARLAAERCHRDEQAADGFRRLLGELQHTVLSSRTAFAQTSRAFHAAVAALAGSPALSLFCRALDDVFTERMERFVYPARRRADGAARQAAIGKAILRGNAAAAERLMREHMLEYNQRAVEARSGGVRSVVAWD